MKDIIDISEQRKELRSIRTHINILFGFIAVLIGFVLTNKKDIDSIFSISLFLAFLFICLAFIYSTIGLEKNSKQNNRLLRKINNLMILSIVFVLLGVTYLIFDLWKIKEIISIILIKAIR